LICIQTWEKSRRQATFLVSAPKASASGAFIRVKSMRELD
jgi:hypothetical protein